MSPEYEGQFIVNEPGSDTSEILSMCRYLALAHINDTELNLKLMAHKILEVLGPSKNED